MRLRLVALKELPKKRFDIFMIDPHAAFAAPDEDENTYLNPSLRGASCATWQSLPST
jgi:hypothetical protein